MDNKKVFKYKLILWLVLIGVVCFGAVWYIKYVRDEIPDKIILNEYSDGTLSL